MPARTFCDHSVVAVFRKTVADDLALLVRLHDRELDAAAVEMLRARRFPAGLGLPPRGPQGQAAIAMLEEAVESLSTAPARLAALSDAYGLLYLSPDRVCARGRLKRTGDDVVVQLIVIGQLIAGGGRRALVEAARYIDGQAGSIRSFADFAEHCCGDMFYAGLACLTDAYSRELREAIRDILEVRGGAPWPGSSASTRMACS